MNKTILIVLTLCIVVFGLLLTKNTTKGQQSNQQNSDDEATIVEKGQPKTEKEKAYSKKFSSNSKLKLSDGIKFAQEKNWKGEILRSVVSEPNQGFGQFSAPKFLQFLVCTSDAVVIGSPKSKTAKLTEDESWVYTEYDF